jgi:branched-chain amino acid transport system permease protein
MSADTVIEQVTTDPIEDEHGLLAAPVTVGLGRRVLLRGLATAVVALVLGLQIPKVITSTYYLGVVTDGVVLGILALGIGFLAHRSGLISLGHTAFYGGSAYAVAIATAHWGWSPMLAAIFALAAGTAFAVATGALVVRTPGMGFLMLTLALGQALYQVSVLTGLRSVTGGFDGLGLQYSSSSTVFGLTQSDLGQSSSFWPLAWTALVVVTVALWLVGRSRFGVVLEAIRENEERARFSGYNTYFPRLVAFAISGACASLAGVLFALHANFVSPDVLSFVTAGNALIATIVGGFAVLVGPVVGAVAYIYAQAKLSDTGNLELYTGIALIVVVCFLPGGVAGGVRSLWYRARALVGSKEGSR